LTPDGDGLYTLLVDEACCQSMVDFKIKEKTLKEDREENGREEINSY
jgi:hypothetical protein